MKNFLKMLFSKHNQVINFKRTTRTVVQVFDTNEQGPKRKKLFYGFISSVDFDNRILVIDEDGYMHRISFDRIVTVSRMSDYRIRIWIKVEEQE